MTKKIKISYRIARTRHKKTDFNLQKALINAYQEIPEEFKRLCDLSQNGKLTVLSKLEEFNFHQGACIGELQLLTRKTEVYGVKKTDKNKISRPERILLDKNIEYLVLGGIYFMIYNNHVVFTSIEDGNSKIFEKYLTAFLQKTNQLKVSEADYIYLDSEIVNSEETNLINEIVEFQITSRPQTTKERQDDMFIPRNSGGNSNEFVNSQIFQGFGIDEKECHDFQQEISPKKMSASVKSFFLGKDNKKTSIHAAPLQRLLRNIPSDDIILKGTQGTVENGLIKKLETKRDFLSEFKKDNKEWGFPLECFQTPFSIALENWSQKGFISI